MAIDNSVITIPPLMSVNATDKVTVPQQVTFNNGVFINNSSLGKPLTKSLYKIWKKNNKLYFFERETTNIENVFHTVSNTIVDYTTQQSEGENILVDFADNSGRFIVTKFTNSLYLSYEFVNLNNDTEESAARALRTVDPYTKVSTLSNSELYKNKSLNIYGLKQDLITRYLQFLKAPQIINTNLFIRLKSLFSNKEINKNYYNYFVYLFSNWGLFGLDTVTTTDFDIAKKASLVKEKLLAPLQENDLSLLNTFKVINSRQIVNNSTNVQLFENVFVSNTTEKTDDISTLTILDQDGNLIIGNDNNSLFLDKIFVFRNKLTNELTAIRTTNFYSFNFRSNGVNRSVIAAFSYNLEFIFNSTGPSLITKNWSDSASSRTRDAVLYDLYVYDISQYIGFHFYNSGILELEIEPTSFRTNSQGDFYVVEIV